MSKRIIRENRTFLAVVIVLFVLFGFVLYFAGYQVKEESAWREETADDLLLSAGGTIKEFFSGAGNDLFFLRDLLESRRLVEAGFESRKLLNALKEALSDFAREHRQYYKIIIADPSGNEIIRVSSTKDGTSVMVSGKKERDRKRPYSIQHVIGLDRDRLYASRITRLYRDGMVVVPYVPVMWMGTPLFSRENEKMGVLIFSVDLSSLLGALPENASIRTGDGEMLSMKPDGSIEFAKSGYDFSGPSGRHMISDKEDLYYSTLAIFPGKELVVTVRVKYPLWKAILDRLKALPAILFVVFLCLMSVIVCINISRFRQVVKAQRVILLSLAGLTEFRDALTGKHLERARNYAVVLAKQLRKLPKYKKVITDEFIDDLYNAAPLHDIGKVAMPDSILLKKGKLDDEEYEKMKGHVLIGKHLLQDVIEKFNLKESFVTMARDICTYHHERWDGTGYTEGLAKEEIPLSARIFSLCDAYDAITSERAFKGQISHKEALRRIRLAKSVQFDPDVVDAFEKCKGEFWEISETWK